MTNKFKYFQALLAAASVFVLTGASPARKVSGMKTVQLVTYKKARNICGNENRFPPQEILKSYLSRYNQLETPFWSYDVKDSGRGKICKLVEADNKDKVLSCTFKSYASDRNVRANIVCLSEITE